MKYIITWILVTLYEGNHNPHILTSPIKEDRHLVTVTIADSLSAAIIYEEKLKQSNLKYTDKAHSAIKIPACLCYIDSVKIDSIKIK